jgi:hypothetical protein
MMAKKSAYFLAGLGVAGVSYFSSKENRQKTMVSFNNLKKRAESWMNKRKHPENLMTKAGHPDPLDVEDNKMVDEGAQYSVNYYNKEKQQK